MLLPRKKKERRKKGLRHSPLFTRESYSPLSILLFFFFSSSSSFSLLFHTALRVCGRFA